MATILNHKVGAIGYGLMGLTWRDSANPPQPQAFAAMDASLASGANFWNGGEIYGTPEFNSCHLLHEYFTKHNPSAADKVLLSIKGGINPGTHRPDGTKAGVRRSVEECLRVLGGVKKLDIFECARKDPGVEIEETVEALAELVKEGKIGGIGLSEVKAETIARAHKVHPIAAVEVELSLWATDILHNGIAKTCAELGIPIVAYSPLCRGMLTANRPKRGEGVKNSSGWLSQMARFPKFSDDVVDDNLRVTEEVDKIAEKRGCTTAQVAIAWVRGMSRRNGLGVIIPIPGATTVERVKENSTDVTLTEEEMADIDAMLKKIEVKGNRYPEGIHSLSDG